mmetsp:Transcript_15661/g.30387  ORF Transcript_15661/g.30387 Transcript_15661/m.30387 type:complete len:213 (-) Transcript_15661:753-1391(-)
MGITAEEDCKCHCLHSKKEGGQCHPVPLRGGSSPCSPAPSCCGNGGQTMLLLVWLLPYATALDCLYEYHVRVHMRKRRPFKDLKWEVPRVPRCCSRIQQRIARNVSIGTVLCLGGPPWATAMWSGPLRNRSSSGRARAASAHDVPLGLLHALGGDEVEKGLGPAHLAADQTSVTEQVTELQWHQVLLANRVAEGSIVAEHLCDQLLCPGRAF